MDQLAAKNRQLADENQILMDWMLQETVIRVYVEDQLAAARHQLHQQAVRHQEDNQVMNDYLNGVQQESHGHLARRQSLEADFRELSRQDEHNRTVAGVMATELQNQARQYETSIASLKASHQTELGAVQKQLQDQKSQHETGVTDLKATHQAKIEALQVKLRFQQGRQQRVTGLKASHRGEVEVLQTELQEQRTRYRTKLAGLKDQLDGKQGELYEQAEQHEVEVRNWEKQLSDQKAYHEAVLNGLVTQFRDQHDQHQAVVAGLEAWIPIWKPAPMVWNDGLPRMPPRNVVQPAAPSNIELLESNGGNVVINHGGTSPLTLWSSGMVAKNSPPSSTRGGPAPAATSTIIFPTLPVSTSAMFFSVNANNSVQPSINQEENNESMTSDSDQSIPAVGPFEQRYVPRARPKREYAAKEVSSPKKRRFV